MKKSKAPWQSGRFEYPDDDPLTGFANIMDVMLVFALGLMLALIAQSSELKKHFKLDKTVILEAKKELVESPEILERLQNGAQDGMESLGQVYRDPKTGKLILIEVSNDN